MPSSILNSNSCLNTRVLGIIEIFVMISPRIYAHAYCRLPKYLKSFSKFQSFVDVTFSTLNIVCLLFSDQIFPCDSNPCQNGATCKNDPKDISKYNCQCANWFTGINCQGNCNVKSAYFT